MESTKDLPKYKLKKIDIDFIDLIADDKVEKIETVLSGVGSIEKQVSNPQTIITVDLGKLLPKIPKQLFVSENNDDFLKIIKK